VKAIGVDVGGTFVDFVLHDTGSGESRVLKLSSGSDPAGTVVAGIEEICRQASIAPAEIELLVHGTTIATNALLEYDGARTGVITTRGFRDVLHIGRHQRPQNYSIQQDIPWQARPLAQRRHRLPVTERIVPPAGEVVVPLDEDEVRAAAEALARDGVEAVAVCFLFSYLNSEHERAAARIVRKVLPDAYVCTSSDVVPQFREFERFTTTAVNAFIGPRVRAYVTRLGERLADAEVGGGLHVMQSNGGTATAEQAIARPVTLLLSGPVGGVIGGLWSVGGDRRRRYVATLDVGGTSADIGIVTESGLVEARARETWIAGYPLMVPMIDIESIGAGGGSIAYVDEAGAPHVGPRSAGAVPGPASYGRGGTEPTVTDANVVLGRLPVALAGGLTLDGDAGRRAVQIFADRLGISPVEAAAGIVDIVNENMAAAFRVKTIERGLDPREFLLCAFGGAGPLQAVELARLLGIPEVVIPPSPGVTSAAGLLASDLRYDVVRSMLRRLDDVEPAALQAAYEEHEQPLVALLRADGCGPDEIEVSWSADLRYRGQGYELTVPVEVRLLDAAVLSGLRTTYDAAHRAEFGHDFPDYHVELVNLRVTAVGKLGALGRGLVSGAGLEDARTDEVEVTFRLDGGLVTLKSPVYERERLPVRETISGPAIVTQLDSTTLVPPDAAFERDTLGNLHIHFKEGGS
jgi:N-methylhydantoinase A